MTHCSSAPQRSWQLKVGAVMLAAAAVGPIVMSSRLHSKLARAEPATKAPPPQRGVAPGDDEQRAADVRRLIDRYFGSWSSQDLERYGRCFMPQAAIQFIDPTGRLGTMGLGAFLKTQQAAQRDASTPMTETAESVEIRFEADLARAVVYWKLVDGERIEYGYDHFTLMKSAGEWRIANLVFYAKKYPGEGR